MAQRRSFNAAVAPHRARREVRWAARARREVGVAALGSLAVVAALFAPAAMADAAPVAPAATIGPIAYTSHYWPSPVWSPSGMTAAWEASSQTSYGGFCNAGVSPLSLDGLSNHSLCGSNAGIISHVAVPFSTTAAGSWRFQVGPDFGNGSEMLVDGVVVSSRWYDVWSDGNLDNTGQVLDGLVTLAAGTHTLEIYGAESCCDGPWRARFQLAGASTWSPVQTSPPQVSVTGLPADATGEFGTADPACLVSDPFDGTSTPPARLSPISGPNAANGVGSRTATCSYTDSRGLSGTASVTYTIVDTGAPTLAGLPADSTSEATGPTGAAVTYASPTATDAVDGALPVTCAPASGATFSLGSTSVTCTATDASANTASASFTVKVVDTTAPVITLAGNVTAAATSANGAAVQLGSATATDLVDGSVPVSCDHASGDTFALGTTTVTCTATDAHHNASTKALTVTVAYPWSGVLAPVTARGSYNLGRTLPVQFTLNGSAAPITNAVAKLYLSRMSGGTVGAELAATSTSAAVSDNSFRYDGSVYIFNLATKGLSAGTYQLRVDLGDGVRHTVFITLK